jgi:hypothetical protein
VKVSVDTAYGGAITYLSQSGSTTNLVNIHDFGREVQQSYYSGPANFLPPGAVQSPYFSPWPWNPTQAGDVYNNRATVLASANTGSIIYIKTRPMQWALNNVPGDCIFEWWMYLDGPAVRVHCKLTNQRSDTTQYPPHGQELPAAYGVGTLNHIFSYTGIAPFTSGALTEQPAAWPPVQFRATENWAALVNSSNFGFGVHNPDIVFTSGGYFSPGTPGTGGPYDNNTSYVAPSPIDVLDANIIYEHDFNLIVGTLTDIRNWVYAQSPDHRPDYHFATSRHGWYANYGDAGPPNGFVRENLNGSDPYFTGPYCAVRAADCPKIYFGARYVMSSPTPSEADLYWETNNTGGLSEARKQSVALTPSPEWKVYAFNVGANTAWNGLISLFRLDPVISGGPGDYVDIAGISYKHNPPLVTGLYDIYVPLGSDPPPISFAVSDDLIPADGLVVSATSSNQALFPDANIHISGSGNSRTLTLHLQSTQPAAATVQVNANDGLFTGGESFTVHAGPTPTPPPKADFNGDGKSDIVWQNTSTGARAIWLMNGASYSSAVSLSTVPTQWQIAGTGDFNGDGKTDILWQNTSTGDRAIWFMHGTALASGIVFANVPLQWQIAGTGDFNGEGKTDILWQNTSTGERAIWLMNGSAHFGTASLGTVPVQWEMRNH